MQHVRAQDRCCPVTAHNTDNTSNTANSGNTGHTGCHCILWVHRPDEHPPSPLDTQMKFAMRVLLVGMLSLLVVGLPVLPEGPLRALQVDQQRVSLAFADTGGGVWISAPIEGEHTIAGLTWEDAADAPNDAEVRVQINDTWSDWEVVGIDDEHAPDPGTQEDHQARGGTSPIVIEGADAVQFRVSDSDAPQDLAVDLVDVDDPDAARRVHGRAGEADAAIRQPTIHPRSDWGGNTCPGRPASEYVVYADKVEILFVHHTAGQTNYSQSQVPAIIHGICSYHVDGRGWDDIGYNTLVDRYGGIWEGRAGGLDKAVQGAHTGGFNSVSTGVVFMGDHENGGAPTAAAQDAFVRYAAWKLDVHGIKPMGKTTVTSGGSSKYPKGTRVTLDNISGHRDASATACPGKSCIARMPTLRERVDAIAMFEDVPKSHNFNADIEWLAMRDITRGCNPPSNTKFCPDGTVTRGQMAAFLTRALNLPAASDAGFRDVSSSHRFYDDINRLAAADITRGCNAANDRFCPDDPVRRDQMAAFLVRAYGFSSINHSGFRDVPAGSRFDLDIRRLATAEVTRGCNPPTNDKYCPTRNVTRAQMAAFLHRADTKS